MRRWRRLLRRSLRWLWNQESGDATAWAGLTDPESVADPNALYAAYRDTAYFCANLNARGVARAMPRLYVRSNAGETVARCLTRPVGRPTLARLRQDGTIHKQMAAAEQVDEVVDHPLLDLLKNPFPQRGIALMSQCELFELTQLYLELIGRAYWVIEPNRLGVPARLWVPRPDQLVAVGGANADGPIDYYRHLAAGDSLRIAADRVIGFRLLDPRSPYSGGLSPMMAALPRVQVGDRYLRQTLALLDNRARPDAVISPSHTDGVIGDGEARRLEQMFNQRFRRRGQGGIFVSRDSLRVDPLTFSPRDLGELADHQLAIEQIARAFDIPLSMLHRDANRASAIEGRMQHANDALLPRLRRLQATLNSRLVPLFDPSGRLFFAFDDIVPNDIELKMRVRQSNLRSGYTTINEERALEGWEPVPWGDVPFAVAGPTLASSPEEPAASPTATDG